MPPKPTCKVVLRPKTRTDKGGARIHPYGCKVRTDVKADGTKITKTRRVSANTSKRSVKNNITFLQPYRPTNRERIGSRCSTTRGRASPQ